MNKNKTKIPEGKKSVSLRIIYQSKDRTLTNNEVDEVENNIKKRLEQDLGARIR